MLAEAKEHGRAADVSVEAAPSAERRCSGPQPPPTPAAPRFINVLVTPKINFSLERKNHWRVAADISQAELREAFLTRFPVRFEANDLHFQPAKPNTQLGAEPSDRLVFRISAKGVEEERVLLGILKELDGAYAAKTEAALEAARADVISASLGFQTIADEVRAAQEAAARKWEREVRTLKDLQKTNQKRLFLLEQERNTLRDATSKSAERADAATRELRADVARLAQENADLRSQTAALTEQMAVMEGCLRSFSSRASASSAGPSAQADGETQTDDDIERTPSQSELYWQQQLSAVSDWLKTGAALLRDPPAPAVGCRGENEGIVGVRVGEGETCAGGAER